MRSRMAKFFREPLVHFMVIGGAFFLLWHFFGDRVTPQPDRIIITPGHVERLAQQWTKTHLRPPSAEELAGLVEQEIDEEVSIGKLSRWAWTATTSSSAGGSP